MKNMEENKYKNPIMEHYEVDGQMNLAGYGMSAYRIKTQSAFLK